MNIYLGAFLHGLWYVPLMVIGCVLAARYRGRNKILETLSVVIITLSIWIGGLSFKWETDINMKYSVQSAHLKEMALFTEPIPVFVAAVVVGFFKKRIRGEEHISKGGAK